MAVGAWLILTVIISAMVWCGFAIYTMTQVPLYLPSNNNGVYYYELTVVAPEDMTVTMEKDGDEWVITVISSIHLEVGEVGMWEIAIYNHNERLIWYKKVGTFDDWEVRVPYGNGKYYIKVERKM